MYNRIRVKLYTISEVINQKYLDRYFAEGEGVLYKAELGSSLSYQGEDPSAYARSFTLQTQVNQADLVPLIAFMRFLSQSDAAAFESELPNYLDVEAFASGAISSQVEQFAALVREANTERNLVDPDTYEAAVQKVLSFISLRMEYLKTTPLLGEE